MSWQAHAQLVFDYLAYVREGMAAIERGEPPGANRFYAKNIITHYPGRSAIAGDHDGETYARKFAAVTKNLKMRLVDVIDILAGESHAAAILKERMDSADGRSIEYIRVAVFRIVDGQFAEIWLKDDDQYAMDAFLMNA